MSTFDPDMFMNSQTTDANDTSFAPIPVGEYQASVKEVKPRVAGDKPVLEVSWEIRDPAVQAETGLEVNVARQTVWLDTNASGGLDFGRGKNVGLGRLRAALGQNTPGQPWAPGMLVGQVAKIKVTHRNGQNLGEVYAQVSSVTAL